MEHKTINPRIHKIGTENPNNIVRLKKVNPFNVILLIAIIGKVNGKTREMYCNVNGIPSNGQATPKIKKIKIKYEKFGYVYIPHNRKHITTTPFNTKVAETNDSECIEINNPKNNPLHCINQKSSTTMKPLPRCTESETIEYAIIHPIKFKKVIKICVIM